jgi:hypothetical protein
VELNQCRLGAERREVDLQWAELQAKREAESKTFSERLAALVDRQKVRPHLPWALVDPNIDCKVGSRLNASLSDCSIGASRPGLDLCSCTAEVFRKFH